jgi:hypothetical protein
MIYTSSPPTGLLPLVKRIERRRGCRGRRPGGLILVAVFLGLVATAALPGADAHRAGAEPAPAASLLASWQSGPSSTAGSRGR